MKSPNFSQEIAYNCKILALPRIDLSRRQSKEDCLVKSKMETGVREIMEERHIFEFEKNLENRQMFDKEKDQGREKEAIYISPEISV